MLKLVTQSMMIWQIVIVSIAVCILANTEQHWKNTSEQRTYMDEKSSLGDGITTDALSSKNTDKTTSGQRLFTQTIDTLGIFSM